MLVVPYCNEEKITGAIGGNRSANLQRVAAAAAVASNTNAIAGTAAAVVAVASITSSVSSNTNSNSGSSGNCSSRGLSVQEATSGRLLLSLNEMMLGQLLWHVTVVRLQLLLLLLLL